MTEKKVDFIALDVEAWREQIKNELKENHSRIIFNDPIEEIYFDVTTTTHNNFNTKPKKKNTFLNGFFNTVVDEKESNKTVLNALMEGADYIEFKIKKESSVNWSSLLYDIEFQYISINISFSNPDQLKSFLNFIDKKDLNYFFLKIDPLLSNFIDFKEILIKNSVCIPSYCINGFEIEQIGANCYQQIGIMLSTFHELLSIELEKGNSIHDFIHLIHFSVGIGQNYFIEIAKIKTLKWLIQQIAHSYGVRNYTPILTANIGWMNKSLNDKETNLLRQTTEAMSALIGGVQTIIVHPFDYFSTEEKSTLYRRMALNIPLILKEEAYFDMVNEPMNGSHVIEGIASQLIEKSWFYFKELDKFKCLSSSEKISKVKTDILAKRKMQSVAIKTNEKEYVGINCLLSNDLSTDKWKAETEYLGLNYFRLEQEFLRK